MRSDLLSLRPIHIRRIVICHQKKSKWSLSEEIIFHNFITLNSKNIHLVKKHFSVILILFFPVLIFSQNVGIGTISPLMKLHVTNADSSVLLLENTEALNTGVNISMYFKTGNRLYPYTGGIKTIGTGINTARLGLFTYAALSPNGLFERMSILDNGNVGIGLVSPSAKLEVQGSIKIIDGTQGIDKVLTSDADGLASWQPAPPPTPALPTYYQSVNICCNSWMIKNLDVDTYRNGDTIPKVEDAEAWAALTTGAYCYFNNDSTTYAAIYGKLYNWYAVNDSRGLAPEGWHVPTDFEWTTTADCLGGDTVAGGLMKEIGTTHWNTPNTGASNLSGFTGLPGGFRDSDGTFNEIGDYGNWWSSTENSTANTWYLYLLYSLDNVVKGLIGKGSGLSVRCLKD